MNSFKKSLSDILFQLVISVSFALSTYPHMNIFMHISTNISTIYSMAEFSHNSGLDILVWSLLFDSLWNSFNKECVRPFMIASNPSVPWPSTRKGKCWEMCFCRNCCTDTILFATQLVCSDWAACKSKPLIRHSIGYTNYFSLLLLKRKNVLS